MGQITFSNGVTINFQGTPTQADIDEMGQAALKQKPMPESTAAKVGGALFKPAAETLTGKSLADRTMDTGNIPITQPTNKPFDRNVQARSTPLARAADILSRTGRGMAGGVADVATTPASYAPIPGARFLGKIPIGATNLGRVASNVAVGPSFLKGVKGMQDLDSVLGNVATSASGKAISTSSRGVVPKLYNQGVNKAILNVYNQAVNPNMGKFNTKAKLDGQQTKITDAMKDIHNNQHNIQFEDPVSGIIQTRNPKNRGELLDSSSQRMGQIYDHYSQLSKKASEGVEPVQIDRAAIAKKSFGDIIRDPNYRTFDPKLVKQAKAIRTDLMKQKPGTPEQVQQTMEYLNRKMKSYYSKEDYNAANVYATYAGNLRQALNKSIEDHMGDNGYSTLKKLYASHAAIQKDLAKAAGRQLKNAEPDTGSHFSNPIALAEMARGVLTGNWAEFGTGAAIKASSMLNKFMTNPDRRIAGMFNFMDKNTLKPQGKTGPTLFKNNYKQTMQGSGPQAQPKPGQPTQQPIVNNMNRMDPNAVGKAVAQPQPKLFVNPPMNNASPDPNGFLARSKRMMQGNSGQVGAHPLPSEFNTVKSKLTSEEFEQLHDEYTQDLNIASDRNRSFGGMAGNKLDKGDKATQKGFMTWLKNPKTAEGYDGDFKALIQKAQKTLPKNQGNTGLKMMGATAAVGTGVTAGIGAHPLPSAKTSTNSSQKKTQFTGQASTYGWGEKLNPKTFSGEKYDPNKVSVAMRNVPMGSTVKITDKKTGKTVEAVVNDGGPNIRTKRVADLSKGAWKALGYAKPGLTDVSIKILKRGKGRTFTQKLISDFSILQDAQ